MINGFGGCISLCRIEIPSSVEVIEQVDFLDCISLTEVIRLLLNSTSFSIEVVDIEQTDFS
jgi:hypothetical protein